jgi:hypothetical protein
MSKSLAELIASEDDQAVCSAVYSRLVDHFGPSANASEMPIEHRTVLLVEYTSGVIGNGGFGEFLGAELPGDPGYQHMLAAYEALDAEPAVAAMRRVFDVYPNRVPPPDRRERVTQFVRANKAANGRLQADFFRELASLPRALAKYIRQHRGSFVGLSDRPRAAVREPMLASQVDSAAAGIDKLPRWARVAFVARCARLVLPLYQQAWPVAPDKHVEALQNAVRLAEISAAQATPTGDLRRADLDAGVAAGAPLINVSGGGISNSNSPEDPDEAHTASFVANAVRNAVQAISKPDRVDEAYDLARSATKTWNRDDLFEQMQSDFLRLRSIVRQCGWTDSTAIPLDVFDPRYEPPGKPWWKVW